MKLKSIVSAVLVVFTLATIAQAGIISINFSENKSNQGFAGGEMIGPLATDSANWNNSNDYPGDLKAGTMADLIDDSGAVTTASVTWNSKNAWWQQDGTADDQHRLSVGYLDDGGNGASITIENIPYAEYRVYGLLSSGQGGAGGEYVSVDFIVNGTPVWGSSADAYGTINGNNGAHGEFWTELDLANGVRGNYWAVDGTSSTATIQGLLRAGGARGSIAGVVIQEIPEPATMALLGLGGLAMIKRRRQA